MTRSHTSLILGLLCILVLTLLPLTSAHSEHVIGVLGGLNLATLRVDPVSRQDYPMLPGFSVGGIVEFGIDDNVSLLVEPMVIKKGSEIEINGQNQGNFTLFYFAVPAMVKFGYGTGSTRPYFLLGPELAFKMSAKGEDADGTEYNLDKFAKSSDFGAGIGGGIDFGAGPNVLFAEARYSVGFTDTNKDSDSMGIEIKTRGLQILGGMTFAFGGNREHDYE